MRATFNASFSCSPSKARKSGEAPIEVSLSINGKRTYIQLPKKCKPEDFQRLMSSKKDNDIKTYCSTIQQRINEIQTTLTVNGEPITVQRIKDYFKYGASVQSYTLEDMFREGLKLKLDENVKPNTYRKYKNAVAHFYSLTGRKPSDEANDIRNEDILAFKAKFGANSKDSTLSKELTYIKYFFSLAFNNGKIKAHPFSAIKIKKFNDEQVYLTYSEVEEIYSAKITENYLDRVRDMFLFMCGTGLEYADMVALKREDVKINQHGQHYIKKRRIKKGSRKIGVEYTAVLLGHALEVWQTYDGDLPLISNAKFNKYLKIIAKKAGIDKNITTLTARHTYGTLALSYYGLRTEVVQKMMGHENPQQTRQYAKMVDENLFKEVGDKAPVEEISRFVYEGDGYIIM